MDQIRFVHSWVIPRSMSTFPASINSRNVTCFSLLSGIPDELRSRKAQTRYLELERKFKTVENPLLKTTDHLSAFPSVSPIKKNSAKEMTDETMAESN